MTTNELPDFGPYDEPLDLPITGPSRCEICLGASVSHIAQMSFGKTVGGEKRPDWVGFGCSGCVTRWSSGPMRRVTYSGLTLEEVQERRRISMATGIGAVR